MDKIGTVRTKCLQYSPVVMDQIVDAKCREHAKPKYDDGSERGPNSKCAMHQSQPEPALTSRIACISCKYDTSGCTYFVVPKGWMANSKTKIPQVVPTTAPFPIEGTMTSKPCTAPRIDCAGVKTPSDMTTVNVLTHLLTGSPLQRHT
jgi:hypothetical protein